MLQVAIHEVGHVLGIMHSENVNSVMHPFYKEGKCSDGLHADDIAAIQMLYGKICLFSPYHSEIVFKK